MICLYSNAPLSASKSWKSSSPRSPQSTRSSSSNKRPPLITSCKTWSLRLSSAGPAHHGSANHLRSSRWSRAVDRRPLATQNPQTRNPDGANAEAYKGRSTRANKRSMLLCVRTPHKHSTPKACARIVITSEAGKNWLISVTIQIGPIMRMACARIATWVLTTESGGHRTQKKRKIFKLVGNSLKLLGKSRMGNRKTWMW